MGGKPPLKVPRLDRRPEVDTVGRCEGDIELCFNCALQTGELLVDAYLGLQSWHTLAGGTGRHGQDTGYTNDRTVRAFPSPRTPYCTFWFLRLDNASDTTRL